jgi:ATP-dependent RNA helicase DHX29
MLTLIGFEICFIYIREKISCLSFFSSTFLFLQLTMAKKKSKVVSNRGYATVSAPKKLVELPVAEKPIEKPVEEPAFEAFEVQPLVEQEDPILKLVKKYESLNDHKAQATLERMDIVSNIPEERVKKFRLTAELEKEILQIIKHEDGDISGMKQ